MNMAVYVVFSLVCAALGLIYLNKGKGSSRLYPSIAAVGVFLFFMGAFAVEKGYDAQVVFSSCAGSIIAGIVVYLLALLIQMLWHKGTAGKVAAVLACAAVFYVSVPTWVVGTVVRSAFGSQFEKADTAAAERREARKRAVEEKIQRKNACEEEILQDIHSDDELCTFFGGLYQRLGYAPVLERVAEDGPLRMFLDKDGQTFSFVAICRRELLGPEAVEWAAGFRGNAQRAGLVTIGTFTGKAVQRAKKLNVALVDRPNLPKIVKMVREEERRKALAIETGETE